MRSPTVEVRWIPDRPSILVQVVMRVGDDDSDARIGTGSTLAEAFDQLAHDIRKHAEVVDDDRMRMILMTRE